MAFDFPATPTVGQTYTSGGVTYRWDGQAWMGGPNTSAGTKVSMLQTPPVSPATGDLWWETDTGNLYVYYDDGTSQQWVQMNYVPPSSFLQSYARLTEQENILINGGFGLNTFGAGAILSTANTYFCDGWKINGITGATAQLLGIGTVGGASQISPGRARVTIQTAKGSLAAGDSLSIFQNLEGMPSRALCWGTTYAKPATLRFGFNGPAGVYGVSIFQQASPNNCYVTTFTVAAGEANTDKIVVLQIPPPPVGTVWDTTTASCFLARICLAAGTTYQSAVGWNLGNFISTSAQFNGYSSTSNVFELFDAKLCLNPDGIAADPGITWEYSKEYTRCLRYWQQISLSFSGYANAASQQFWNNFQFWTPMRATPSYTVAAAGSLGNCTVANPVLALDRAVIPMVSVAAGPMSISDRNYQFDARL